jgi:hypothetical protein
VALHLWPCMQAFPFFGLTQQLVWGLLRNFFPPRGPAEWQVQFERAMDGKKLAVRAYRELRARGELGRWPPTTSLLETQVTGERCGLRTAAP